jgi:endonuclease YncB( thermonuclease family)
MSIPRPITAALLATALLLASSGIAAPDTVHGRYYIAGPVEAELVSVIDGDTLMVNARPWPQQTVSVLVRIRGIDTPEIHAKCPKSRTLAREARNTLERALSTGSGKLSLTSISGDKYFGRVVADVAFGTDQDAASVMLAAGLARPYDGGRKARESCDRS